MSHFNMNLRVWLAIAATLSLAGLVGPTSASGSGATYDVLKCYSDLSRFDNDDEIVDGGGGARYLTSQHCAPGDPLQRLAIENTGPELYGHQGSYTISAPDGTLINAVWFESNLAQANGHVAQVLALNSNDQRLLRQSTAGGDFGYVPTYAPGLNHTQVQMRVICVAATCASSGAAAHAYVRNIHLVLRDSSDPAITSAGGSLLGGGWVSGDESLWAVSGDAGSGVVGLQVFVNGGSMYNAVASAKVACSDETPPYTPTLTPCHGTPNFAVSSDTASGPFRNGENGILLKATDYAGNVTVKPYSVMVDNEKPTVHFANSQDPNEPELIRARVSDGYSGVATARIFLRAIGTEEWRPLETTLANGTASARVDSLSLPPGEYEFHSSVKDVAGNIGVTNRREDGARMILTFPLKDDVELRAHLNRGGSRGQIVRYGSRSKAKGILVDAAGRPLAGQQVAIVEHFGAGALVRERVSHATTDERGKWRSKLPAGPSRDIDARFNGTARYAPAGRLVGTLGVRSRASFDTSRRNVPEGKAVRFKGKVGHFGARIPSGGKLLQLQVRIKAGRWQTVGEAFRTNERGRYYRRYRFGKHYLSDALFRFRVKVMREARWPYRRTNTAHRKVIVRAH